MTTAIKTQGSEKEHRQPSLLDMAKATAGSLRHAAGVFAVSAAVAVPLAFGNSSASARGYNPWETAAARIVENVANVATDVIASNIVQQPAVVVQAPVISYPAPGGAVVESTVSGYMPAYAPGAVIEPTVSNYPGYIGYRVPFTQQGIIERTVHNRNYMPYNANGAVIEQTASRGFAYTAPGAVITRTVSSHQLLQQGGSVVERTVGPQQTYTTGQITYSHQK
jgi:hypothetical protein